MASATASPASQTKGSPPPYPSDEKIDQTSVHSGAININAGVDVSVGLVAGRHADDAPLDPEEARRIRNKLDKNILPLLFLLYTVQSIDKSTLAISSILGLIQDNHLKGNQFNTLGSAFYLGFLVFQYPHNLALQRFPVAKYLTANIFLWSIFLGLHCVCTSFSGLFALRFLLGCAEGSITAGLMLITTMFYTRVELTERIGWSFQCNGVAQIVGGFIQFGVAHVSRKEHPNQWQWLFIITTILTIIVACLFALRFPDNPTTARFLNEEEKVKAIKRIRDNRNGIETKVWKKAQLIEALTDPKTWFFFFFAAISNLQNGIGIQYSLIIKGFNFNLLETALLSIPSGFAQIIGVTTFCFLLRLFPNRRGYLACLAFIPSILGAVLLMTLPLHNRVGLLISFYLTSLGGAPGFVLVLSWVAAAFSGHTKRLAANAIFLIGYSLGQILSPQFWHDNYKPRNYVPWGINLATYVVDICILLALRSYLARENARRDALDLPDDEYGYVETTDENGRTVQLKVEKALLDFTDQENLSFRYPL
jgi:MFS family permease